MPGEDTLLSKVTEEFWKCEACLEEYKGAGSMQREAVAEELKVRVRPPQPALC